MFEMNYNSDFYKDIENVVGWIRRLEPTLAKDFVTYWSIRKSPSYIAKNIIEGMKDSSSNEWINLIESNHKFRDTYGEEKADELVSIIENRRVLAIK